MSQTFDRRGSRNWTAEKREFEDRRMRERRGGGDRRKLSAEESGYTGPERRSGQDRRLLQEAEQEADRRVEERRGDDRRQEDRRSPSVDPWEGIERRLLDDRRERERRAEALAEERERQKIWDNALVEERANPNRRKK